MTRAGTGWISVDGGSVTLADPTLFVDLTYEQRIERGRFKPDELDNEDYRAGKSLHLHPGGDGIWELMIAPAGCDVSDLTMVTKPIELSLYVPSGRMLVIDAAIFSNIELRDPWADQGPTMNTDEMETFLQAHLKRLSVFQSPEELKEIETMWREESGSIIGSSQGDNDEEDIREALTSEPGKFFEVTDLPQGWLKLTCTMYHREAFANAPWGAWSYEDKPFERIEKLCKQYGKRFDLEEQIESQRDIPYEGILIAYEPDTGNRNAGDMPSFERTREYDASHLHG